MAVRQGDLYGPEYVTALARQVEEHTGEELITLTDRSDTPGQTKQMRHGFTGFWSKIELFAPDHEDIRPCFYLDLDTFVRRDIRDMLMEPETLHLIRDFNVTTRANSGLMLIPKRVGSIWSAARKWPAQPVDGDFLTTQPHAILQDRFDGIVSYKRHCKELPRGRVICFHGRPRPAEAKGWAADYWKHYAE